MALAAEHFRALRESGRFPESLPPYEAARTLNDIISETQSLTLSQLPSSNAKQLGSILFSHEGGLISAFDTMNPPQIKRTKGKFFNTNLLLTGLGALIALAAVYMLWQESKIVLALFVVVAAALALVGYFLPRNDSQVSASESVDMDALLSLAERRMQAIDRDLDAFLSIPPEGSEGDDSMLRIITLAAGLKREDPSSVPDELMTAITALSISKGYDFLEYSADCKALFDVMPTKRQSRTIVPAVVKEGQLVAKGMAILNIAEDGEA
ncbi:MAG: hypothetical protein K5663_00120 [Clostridiales bacterium]|nr:hypothetical protein [Clostridiales bacterium]